MHRRLYYPNLRPDLNSAQKKTCRKVQTMFDATFFVQRVGQHGPPSPRRSLKALWDLQGETLGGFLEGLVGVLESLGDIVC